MCLLDRSASADPGFLDRGSNFHRGGGGCGGKFVKLYLIFFF